MIRGWLEDRRATPFIGSPSRPSCYCAKGPLPVRGILLSFCPLLLASLADSSLFLRLDVRRPTVQLLSTSGPTKPPQLGVRETHNSPLTG